MKPLRVYGIFTSKPLSNGTDYKSEPIPGKYPLAGEIRKDKGHHSVTGTGTDNFVQSFVIADSCGGTSPLIPCITP